MFLTNNAGIVVRFTPESQIVIGAPRRADVLPCLARWGGHGYGVVEHIEAGKREVVIGPEAVAT